MTRSERIQIDGQLLTFWTATQEREMADFRAVFLQVALEHGATGYRAHYDSPDGDKFTFYFSFILDTASWEQAESTVEAIIKTVEQSIGIRINLDNESELDQEIEPDGISYSYA